ncbi:hypothetical protein C2S53_016937 [Perilla frutescens var. hirtella]|uniref:BHLH domain-containing protein n=1 Tax=Perilla frutescens var. hirtella TaxID=608512 RepID=A0AAD4J751_PERFH|nr:hypothetical protein C2S53_016937 [Perilla frutescens var. hirtella]
MFSLQPCDELDFQTSTTTYQGYQIKQDDDHSLLQSNNFISFSANDENRQLVGLTTKVRAQTRRRQADRSSHEGGLARRFVHRDVERKRRQEMSNLFVSLRTLLPLEHLNKGKISVCDQMEEAAKYIKQMHKKVEELGSRRDKLKKLYVSSSSSSSSRRDQNVEISLADGDDTLIHNSVAIHKILHGFEILISNKSPNLELSRVLAELEEIELDVVNCLSTRTGGGFHHKLEIEAMDMASLDLSVLRDRLTEAIK